MVLYSVIMRQAKSKIKEGVTIMKKCILLFIIAIMMTGCSSSEVEAEIECDEKVIEIKTGGYESFSISKETAIKIGRALLEEHFPDTFLNNNELQVDAEEKDGIWKVFNVVERVVTMDDGQMMYIDGGELYVEFRKSNGEVLNIGIND